MVLRFDRLCLLVLAMLMATKPSLSMCAETRTIAQIVQEEGYTKYAEACNQTGLLGPMNLTIIGLPFTAFVPTNSAFESYYASNISDALDIPLRSLINFHWYTGLILNTSVMFNDMVRRDTMATDYDILPFVRYNNYGGKWFINSLRVEQLQDEFPLIIRANVEAVNGIIHVIDHVIVPQALAADHPSIFQEVMINPNLSTLADALTLANFSTSVINLDLPSTANALAYTFFAPTNTAWEALPPGYLDAIYRNTEALRNLIASHIVNSTYFSVGLPNGTLTTMSGEKIQISRDGSELNSTQIIVNGTTVVQRDVHRSTGVIHTIDKVLVPQDLCVAPFDDTGGSLGPPTFWCSQLRVLRLRGRTYVARYTSTMLLEFVTWVSKNSIFFKDVTTLSMAETIVCGDLTTLQVHTYSLWLSVASGNVFQDTKITSICDPSVLFRINSVDTPPGVTTIQDALDGAEGILAGQVSIQSGSSFSSFLIQIQNWQSPGTGGCPITCGSSAVADAVSNSDSFYNPNAPNTTWSGAAMIGTIVAIVIVALLVIGVVLYLLRAKIRLAFTTR